MKLLPQKGFDSSRPSQFIFLLLVVIVIMVCRYRWKWFWIFPAQVFCSWVFAVNGYFSNLKGRSNGCRRASSTTTTCCRPSWKIRKWKMRELKVWSITTRKECSWWWYSKQESLRWKSKATYKFYIQARISAAIILQWEAVMLLLFLVLILSTGKVLILHEDPYCLIKGKSVPYIW